jgi:hypothetical protein
MNISRTVTHRDAYISAAIRGERERLAAAAVGNRNQTLFRCASALASLGVREGTVLTNLRASADAIGLTPREFFRTVKSAMKTGQARPRSISIESTNRLGPSRLMEKATTQTVAVKEARAELPERTRGEGAPRYHNGDECPHIHQEVRRHVYTRRGEPVRVKFKKSDGSYLNWYRVQDGDRRGWQAAKPDGYVDCPYYGIDPFDPELGRDILFWPEGEKDCDTLAACAELAFCFGGCGDGLPDFDTRILEGRHIVILADNDDAGRSHADSKAARIHKIAASVRVVHFPDLPTKGDVSDWIEAGNTIEALHRRVGETPLWVPSIPPASEDSEQRFSWAEPDASVIDDRRGDLPELPIDTVPPSWRNWLQRSAHGAGVTEAHVFVPLLAISSSLIGTARRVQASRSWSEPMTMWTAIVGFSGSGKTPGIDVTKRALGEVQKLKVSAIAALERGHNAKREEAKIAKKKWSDAVEDAVANGLPAPPMPENAVDVPAFTPPRLFVSDATVERLAVMLQSRPSGALYVADELAGLFLNMGRYSGGSDKEFWLEAWNAKPYVVERMGRPAVNLDHLLIGVTGGLQPDKLQKSFGVEGDGMYARVLFAWPAEPKYRPLTNDVAEIEPEIVNVLLRLLDLSPLGEDLIVRAVALSTDAVAEFEQFRQFLHHHKHGLDGREREWWSKGEAHVLRLAGTLTYLEWARGNGAEPSEIPAENMTRSIRLFRDYLWSHARASLRQIGLSEKHAIERRILRWIKANKLPGEEISAMDIRREALSQSLDEAAVYDVVARLEASCWLRQLPLEKAGAGRPRKRWEANPLLY